MEWLKDKLNGFVADLMNGWKSLTLWINGIALTVVSGLPMLQETFPQLQEYISPQLYKQIMFGIIALNIILRFKTNTALRDK